MSKYLEIYFARKIHDRQEKVYKRKTWLKETCHTAAQEDSVLNL